MSKGDDQVWNANRVTGTTDKDAYTLVTTRCKQLGFHGICPEGLAAMRGMNESGFLTDETRAAFDIVMRDLEAMFAPVRSIEPYVPAIAVVIATLS